MAFNILPFFIKMNFQDSVVFLTYVFQDQKFTTSLERMIMKKNNFFDSQKL